MPRAKVFAIVVNTRAFRWYVGVTGLVVVVHPFLPPAVRHLTFLAVPLSTLVPIGARLRQDREGGRLTWLMLAASMGTLTAANVINTYWGPPLPTLGTLVAAVGHLFLLASALTLVVRRGRNDFGGVVDAAIALTGVGSLCWITVVQPHLTRVHSPLNVQASVLVAVFVLAGVLGGLGRLWFASRRRIVALELFIVALLLGLAGNLALSATAGLMSTEQRKWIGELVVLAYLCVGAAAAHPSAAILSWPSPRPIDRFTVGRLFFLGAATAVNPVLGGIRQLFDGRVDGLLIAAGSLIVTPLVMARIYDLGRQREMAEAALAHQATHDALTGLLNRTELRRHLAAALERERVAGRLGVVLLFCDLNGFKLVNDRLGHAVGDRLLVAVARGLADGLAPCDTLARYGGDEFLLLCEDVRGGDALQRLCDHVHRALFRPFLVAGEPIRVSASVGAVRSDGVADADELIRRADESMYANKRVTV
jgi:diguanylate cyclase (GGDEF)-like protein